MAAGAVPAVVVQRTLEMALGDGYCAVGGAVTPALDRLIIDRLVAELRATRPHWYEVISRSWLGSPTPPAPWVAAQWLARCTPAEALRVAGTIAGPA